VEKQRTKSLGNSFQDNPKGSLAVIGTSLFVLLHFDNETLWGDKSLHIEGINRADSWIVQKLQKRLIMPPVKTSASVLSVLARFEQTIEQNNASGVASGMYLTKLASSSRDKASSRSRNRTATSSLSSSQHSTSRSTSSSKRPANEKYRTSTRLSKVSTGVRDGSGKREFDESKVPNKSDPRDTTSEDRGWNASTDTRAAKSFDASFNSLLHDDESSVSDMSQETFGFDDFAFDDPFMPTGSKGTGTREH
jgi:hypothetical protein